jgi:hypothetical protein
MEELEIHECEDGNIADPCEGEVVFTHCPYAEEIHDEIVPVWLCDYHYGERCMEI